MKIQNLKICCPKQLQIFLFIASILFFNDVHSQVSIKGNIRDAYGNPIEFATIQLLFDSINHQSTLSDTAGNYLLNSSLKGECELLTNFLGYTPARKKVYISMDTTINFTLQTDTVWMDEVTITAKKDLIQAKSDRLIVNVAGNIETKGKETTDILKQLPTLNVSSQSMEMSGKSSVIVYINDRIVRLSGQSLLSYLNSLPPDIISSIEIISTPPAQYEAEGNVGIIKIVTKKDILPGWKEYFVAAYRKNTYSSYRVSAFVNYTGKKMFFEANIVNGSYPNLLENKYSVYYPEVTISTFNPKKWGSSGSDAHGTFGYNFNKNSNLLIDFQAPLSNEEEIRDIENKTSFIDPFTEQIDSIIDSRGKTIKNKYTYNSEVFFKHVFPNKKSFFTANAAYLNNYTLNRRTFASTTQIENVNNTTENYFTEGSQKYDILTSKLDFSFPVLNCTVNTGLKLSFINTTSNNKFYNYIATLYVLNSSLSNKYEYNENVEAAYFSMEKSIQNWSFKAGLRSEITQTIGKSFSTNESYTNDYMDFFPTLFVSHSFKNRSNLSFNYNTRIDRPPYQFLDPFKWYITKYDYAVGNPFLQPSYIQNIELSYMFNSTFSTKLYYTTQNDKIGQYVVLDSLDIGEQVQIADNFLNEKICGVNLYKLLKISNWMETSLKNDFYYAEYFSNNESFSNVSGYGNIVSASNTIILHKNLQCVINLEENIPGLYNYREKNNYFTLDAGINYFIPKENMEARLYVGDILKTANPEYHYSSGGIKQVYKNYNDSRMVRLIVSWRLGNWYNKSSHISSPSNAEEKNRF